MVEDTDLNGTMETQSHTHDSNSNGMLDTKTTVVYDDQGNLASRNTEKDVNEDGINDYAFSETFDADGNRTSYSVTIYEDGMYGSGVTDPCACPTEPAPAPEEPEVISPPSAGGTATTEPEGPGGPDYEAYVDSNADLTAAWNDMNQLGTVTLAHNGEYKEAYGRGLNEQAFVDAWNAGEGRRQITDLGELSKAEWGELHYEVWGQNEGRELPMLPGTVTPPSSGGTAGAETITDASIRDTLDAGGEFKFSFEGKDYTLRLADDGKYKAYDANNTVVDAEVRIGDDFTVDGFVEVGGLSGLGSGNRLYIGADPETGAVAFIEASAELDANDALIEGRSHLDTLLQTGERHPALVLDTGSSAPMPESQAVATLAADFGHYDADGNGFLSKQELQAVVDAGGPMAETAQTLLDSYNNAIFGNIDPTKQAWAGMSSNDLVSLQASVDGGKTLQSAAEDAAIAIGMQRGVVTESMTREESLTAMNTYVEGTQTRLGVQEDAFSETEGLDHLAQNFSDYDTDGSGFLSKSELQTIVDGGGPLANTAQTLIDNYNGAIFGNIDPTNAAWAGMSVNDVVKLQQGVAGGKDIQTASWDSAIQVGTQRGVVSAGMSRLQAIAAMNMYVESTQSRLGVQDDDEDEQREV